MATYADWEDVKVVYELPIPDDHQPRVEALLRQATARLNALVPSLPARIAAGDIDPDLASSMVIEAVLRVYRNPAGITQQSTGPFSRSLNREAARNNLYFDPADIAALLDTPTLGVGTFRLGIPAPQVPVTALDADGRYLYTPEQLRGL